MPGVTSSLRTNTAVPTVDPRELVLQSRSYGIFISYHFGSIAEKAIDVAMKEKLDEEGKHTDSSSNSCAS